MAGIIGQIGPGDSTLFIRAAGLLRHGRHFDMRQYRDDDRVKLAAVYREDAPASDTYLRHKGVGVIVYGSPLGALHSEVVTASELIDVYLGGGEAALTDLDGGFLIAVLDEPRGELIVVNDRTATHTLTYVADRDRFTFAPEAKAALLASEREPRLDVTGSLEFLSVGYPVGQRTLFADACIMPPGHVLRVVLRDGSFELSPYWDLTFRENPSLRDERAAVAALTDTLTENVTRAAQAARGKYDLLLTGGHDSRALLELADGTGSPPRRAIGWGVDAGIPASDPYIARRLAAHYGVPFTFLHYDFDSFCEQAERWAFISEIGSDNLGNFAAGPHALTDTAVAPAVFNGDQLLGFGGIPLSFTDAFEVGTGLPYRGLAPGVAAMLSPERASEAADRTRDGLLRMALDRRGEPNKDVQDYLVWQAQGIRLLNAPMFHREPMVSPWRPLAHRSAIEFFEQLPASWRVDKRLLVRMLETRTSGVLDLPIASANSLVDWTTGFTSASPTGEFFRAVAAEALFLEDEIGTFFDADAFRAVLGGYLDARHVPISRAPRVEKSVVRLRRGVSRWRLASLVVRGAQRVGSRMMGRAMGASTTRVLWRIVLLSLLLRTIREGWFTTGAPWQTASLKPMADAVPWPSMAAPAHDAPSA